MRSIFYAAGVVLLVGVAVALERRRRPLLCPVPSDPLPPETPMYLPEAQEVIDKGSPSQSRSRRYPDDQFLRLHGWQIHARPKCGTAMWRKGTVILSEQQALAVIRAGKKPDAA